MVRCIHGVPSGSGHTHTDKKRILYSILSVNYQPYVCLAFQVNTYMFLLFVKVVSADLTGGAITKLDCWRLHRYITLQHNITPLRYITTLYFTVMLHYKIIFHQYIKFQHYTTQYKVI